MVAGVSSGVGKTTVATGLMAALAARGLRVAGAKVGPDYIDPGYHALATGRPGRNLDAWICGEESIAPLAGRAAAAADVLVVEGAMGLFDGAAVAGPVASTASVAALLEAPVVLVVDAAGMSSSVGAVVRGFLTHDPRVRVAGVVCNRAGSAHHEATLRDALAPLGVPVLGVLHRDDALLWRSRHLGLVPVVEDQARTRAALDRVAAAVAGAIDLEAVLALACAAPARVVPAPPLPGHVARVRVAVAAGRAFSFVYRDNLEALEAAGAEVLVFDPLTERRLPEDADALYVGGGFPEVYAAPLAENRPLLDDVRARLGRGLPTWVECGGLVWLSRSLDGAALAGVVDARATMTTSLTLGYRRATAARPTVLCDAGGELRGHEFHYSRLEPHGDALELRGRQGTSRAGYGTPSLLASYLHLHLGGAPAPAERFVHAAATHRERLARVRGLRLVKPVRVRRA